MSLKTRFANLANILDEKGQSEHVLVMGSPVLVGDDWDRLRAYFGDAVADIDCTFPVGGDASALRDAIAAGAKAATIFGSGLLDDGVEPPLLERMRAMAHRAGILICGGNGSGFYNHADRVRCQMGGGPAAPAGSVTFIAQSGSITAAVCGNDGRLQFNLAVSSGQEITTDVSDYMDFALGMESTRAIGLFIETIRNPDGFIRVLRRAAAMDIPIVVNKVGRSEASQRFAVSHSGALTGNDAVHDAVFAHYGVMRVDDPDELLLRDTRLALPPLDRAAARRLIDGLAIRPILDGVRGRPALDVDALADAFAHFSVMIAALGGSLAEVDVNPIILGTRGVVAVDGLIIPAADARRPNSQ